MKNLRLLFVALLFSFFATAQTPEFNELSSLQKTVSELKIKIFPTPALNVVNILGLVNSNKADITISDITGNIVLKRQWAIRNNAVSIPVPNLISGIYAIQINSIEQNIQTRFYKK